MPSHRINLRGPWDYRWISDWPLASSEKPGLGTITMPQDWQAIFGSSRGTAEFRRKFHRPTNLEPHERVTILMTEVRGAGRVKLNETNLGEFVSSGDPVEFDVTACLQSFNELIVEITCDPGQAPEQSSGLFGVTAIQISSD